jgi:hypothetical protein
MGQCCLQASAVFKTGMIAYQLGRPVAENRCGNDNKTPKRRAIHNSFRLENKAACVIFQWKIKDELESH